MRVFVLGTGRCGTMTFARACEHVTNFTSAHESKRPRRKVPPVDSIFQYPDNHIEIDGGLAWHAALLVETFDRDDVFYVHLQRDTAEVVESFSKRITYPRLVNTIQHCLDFDEGHLAKADLPVQKQYTAFLMGSINASIRSAIRDKPHMHIRTNEMVDRWAEFCSAIGATCNRGAAIATLQKKYNKTKSWVK